MHGQLENLTADHEARLRRIGEIEDEALVRELRSGVFSLYYGALEYSALDSAPYEIEYTTPHFERLDDYPDFAALTAAYLNNFVAKPTSSGMQCFQVNEPFILPFAHSLEMETLIMADGEVLQMPDLFAGRRQTAELRSRGDAFCFLKPESKASDPPKFITAEFFTHVPDKLVHFEFSRDDIGATKTEDGYAVTLLEMNDNSYAVQVAMSSGGEMTLQAQDIVGEAKAENGQSIRPRTSLNYSADFYLRMQALMDDLIERAHADDLQVEEIPEQIKALQQKIAQENSAHVFKAFAFHGAVNDVQVTLVHRDSDTSEGDSSEGNSSEGEIQQRLQIPFYSEFLPTAKDVEIETLPEITVPGPVFNYQPAVRAEHIDLSLEEMTDEIEIRHRRISSDPSITHPAQIFLHYPHVQSDRFIWLFDRYGDFSADNVQFLNEEGEQIAVTVNQDELALFTVSRLEYDPEQLPEKPARIQAMVSVQTAPDIQKQSYARDELPEGVYLTGNRLAIDYAIFEPVEMEDVDQRRVERRNQVFAKDANGRYLAEVASMTQSRESGQPIDLYYFYGEPEFFEIWYRGPVKTINFEFDVQVPAS